MEGSTSQLNFNFTRLSKALAGVLCLGYVVQLVVPTARHYLTLVPGRTIPCVWNVFTAGLVETDIFRLILSLVGVLMLAKIVEPVWGSKGFLLFTAVVNFWTGFSTFVLVYLLFTIDRKGDLLYTEICGFQGVFAGLLVGLKQTMPENDVTVMAYVKFRAKHLPAIFNLLTLTGALLLGSFIKTVPFVVFGTYISWFYLRFFQSKPETSLQGDPSDEFRFATFFPVALHPVIDRIAGLCSQIFRVGLQQGPARADSGTSLPLNGAPLPGSDAAEAARRRERGARALEERLGKKATASGQSPNRSPPLSQPPDIEAPAPQEAGESAE
ncbi:hypothetical protein ABBQ38_005383 [Trebouxia sp. C0009 RCD-2024]